MGTFNETTALRSAVDVEKWVGKHSLEALEEKMIDPNFGDINLRVAKDWIANRKARADAIDAARALKAAETSALAADKSATAAQKSLFWARSAFVVSIAALVVTYWKP